MPETRFCGDMYRNAEQLYAVWQKMVKALETEVYFRQQHIAKLNAAYERARKELEVT